MSKKIKIWLSTIVTSLLVVVLFATMFVSLGLVELSVAYFIELGIVTALILVVKSTWYNSTEERRLQEKDIVDAKATYDELVTERIKNVNDFDKFLLTLDKENKEKFIQNKMGSRTKKSLGYKKYHKYMVKFKKQAKKLKLSFEDSSEYINEQLKCYSQEDLGEEKYNKLLYKYTRQADKIQPLKSVDIITRGECAKLYDSKNYQKDKKRKYQITSTITSVCLTVALAGIAFNQLILNWESAFRFASYLYTIAQTVVITIHTASKNTYEESVDQLSRLEFILDKYRDYEGA